MGNSNPNWNSKTVTLPLPSLKACQGAPTKSAVPKPQRNTTCVTPNSNVPTGSPTTFSSAQNQTVAQATPTQYGRKRQHTPPDLPCNYGGTPKSRYDMNGGMSNKHSITIPTQLVLLQWCRTHPTSTLWRPCLSLMMRRFISYNQT